MGAKARLRKRLGREPTREEVRDERERKRRKREAKTAAASAATAPQEGEARSQQDGEEGPHEWTHEEDVALLSQRNNDHRWVDIAAEFDMPSSEVQARFKQLVRGRRRGGFEAEEDEELARLVGEAKSAIGAAAVDAGLPWTIIGASLGRSSKVCHDRWRDVVGAGAMQAPSLSPAQELELVGAVHELDADDAAGINWAGLVEGVQGPEARRAMARLSRRLSSGPEECGLSERAGRLRELLARESEAVGRRREVRQLVSTYRGREAERRAARKRAARD